MNKIDRLKEMINDSKSIVALTGAGVSTLSGIPDFRSENGLYNRKNKYNFEPEYLLSSDCFYKHCDIFYEYYKENMNSLKYMPNIIHEYLKKLEDDNKLIGVVTQNIDGLDKKADIKNVLEIHGSVNDNYCLKCNKYYDASYIFKSIGIPKCVCGGIIKPRVVLYGEELPQDTLYESIRRISTCDMLIVLGTSLTVFPASGLVNYFRGKYLVLINKDSTSYDNRFDLIINDDFKKVFNDLT